ncbi:prephenate dehydratase [Cerasibacillus terrae]|uniref:Prephenate dehydratase n=1 Tax=Cerasibacillus terrae TaxID=2498845 RepID=A0A5C8P2N1_9BACI|nr:prephenate dehydratase [Cerasibacillus terrae]TXL67622.1 prephenate dehydratase [Cerasibacillus terrae]
MRLGFLGPKATFTDIAVRALFPDETAISYSTIPECLDAVEAKEVDIAVVPLENALEGSVNITLDYLTHEINLPIIGEITAPIRQHLMVHPQNVDRWKKVEKIYSHSHAIAQCHKFLHKQFRGVPSENTTSTARAAKYVFEHPQLNVAAIANNLAAREYGLTIVQSDIHDFHYNHTRFVILTSNGHEINQNQGIKFNGYKTTVMVQLPDDRSGALHQVLSAFSWRKLNLTKIESRPMKTGLGNYFFIIDIASKLDDVLIPGAIAELEALKCNVKVLGSYPSFIIDATTVANKVKL